MMGVYTNLHDNANGLQKSHESQVKSLDAFVCDNLGAVVLRCVICIPLSYLPSQLDYLLHILDGTYTAAKPWSERHTRGKICQAGIFS